MIRKKIIALIVIILFCLSTLTLSGCINSRSVKTAEKAISFVSVVIGIVAIWDWFEE